MFGRFFGARHFGRRFFGKAGLTVPGVFFGARYFGGRYYGERYWGSNVQEAPSFELSVSAGLALAGVLSAGSVGLTYSAVHALAQSGAVGLTASMTLGGSLVFEEDDTDFSVTPPMDIQALSGAVLVSGDITIADGGPAVLGSYWGRDYYGQRYFGGRYFGRPPTFSLSAGEISLSGSTNVAGTFETEFTIAFLTSIEMAGVVSLDEEVALFGEAPTAVDDDEVAGGGNGLGARRGAERRRATGLVDGPDHLTASNAQLIELLAAVVSSGALD
jgi:hypothetical protein